MRCPPAPKTKMMTEKEKWSSVNLISVEPVSGVAQKFSTEVVEAVEAAEAAEAAAAEPSHRSQQRWLKLRDDLWLMDRS